MGDFALDITTKLKPAREFRIDGSVYKLLGPAHLSPEDEAKTTALFARHSNLAMQVENELDVQRGTGIAVRLRNARIDIICHLTDVPKRTVEDWPLPVQSKVMEAIRGELELQNEDDMSSAAAAEAAEV